MTLLMELIKPEIAYPADGSVVPVERAVWGPFELEPVAEGYADRLAGKKIVIAGGSGNTARQLAQALTEGGAAVYHFEPGDTPLEQAGLAFKALTGPVDGIIDLNVAEAYPATSQAAWQTALRQTVTLLKLYYEEWAYATDTTRLFYLPITRLGGTMGFETGRGEIGQPFGGIWAGLAKTLPREIPNCNLKILDFSNEDFPNLSRIVAREIYRWGLFEIGYKGGRRYGLACRREKVGEPVIQLDSRDTILLSGGGRGIGHAMAKALARNFGCRVITTGRSPLPAGADWLAMDAASFKAYTQGLYRSIPAGKKVGDVRREVEQLKSQKELYDNMQAVTAEGLRVEYQACDFTSPAQLNRLIAEIGPGLSGVIHNAGVDTPVRLPSKTPDNFVQTVSIKLNGFMNLFEALKDRPLKFFCNVGSLTGRWGGMVGQLDYASGNEGLARLGLWAAPQVNFPLKTLSWPTWDRLGMIANFEATLKYMSAVDVNEGLYHWQSEILTGGSGEVCFNGPVGSAVTPAHLRGFPVFSEVPQAERLFSPLFFTGEILDFQIFTSVRAASWIEPRVTPAMYDFTLAGRPALPVSLLLEYAVSLAEWLAPEGWPELYLETIRGLEIDLAGLRVNQGEGFTLLKDAVGSWQEGKWVVELNLAVSRKDNPARQPLARLEVVFNRRQPASITLEGAGQPAAGGKPVSFEDSAPPQVAG
jgi:NAD(P)-dependent dehydrogenase (short-subunit alcohol dehydrogenase family)